MQKIKVFLFLILIFLCGCQNNELKKEDFIEIGKFNGYILEEDMTNYDKYSYIKDVYYAVNREDAYEIQFLELESDDYAKRFFDYNKNDLATNQTSECYVKQKSNSNYSLYHLENDYSYMLVLRSKNNIIYIKAPIEYINEIEEFLHELNLEY